MPQPSLIPMSDVGLADPGFLAACDALDARIWAEFAMAYGFLAGLARAQQTTTETSARATRASAHAAGLPVAGGGR